MIRLMASASASNGRRIALDLLVISSEFRTLAGLRRVAQRRGSAYAYDAAIVETMLLLFITHSRSRAHRFYDDGRALASGFLSVLGAGLRRLDGYALCLSRAAIYTYASAVLTATLTIATAITSAQWQHA